MPQGFALIVGSRQAQTTCRDRGIRSLQKYLSGGTSFIVLLGPRGAIVDDFPPAVERPILAAHCLMQNASSASRPLVQIDDRRPEADSKLSREQTFNHS
ncbi:hypothetical protein PCAR4_1340038 [Paraburkholderia caribensis]|nr:hypothetical protein PCAR4_1340038 [Paraburkholderia caribensis]